jgi:hypothetical protein
LDRRQRYLFGRHRRREKEKNLKRGKKMKKRILAIGLGVGFLLAAQAASAFVYDNEGANGSGTNDSAATAQNLGTLGAAALTVRGWVDANNVNDIDFYSFAVASPAGVFFDVDYANDFGSTADNDTGVDAFLAVFNGSQQLIAYNDDSFVFNYTTTDPGSLPFGDFDPFLGSLPLAPGNYYAVISSFANEPNAFGQAGITETDLSVSGTAVSGALADSTYALLGETTGQYQLQIRFTEEDQPVGPAPVPLPPAVLLLGPGLVSLYAARKKNSRKQGQ